MKSFSSFRFAHFFRTALLLFLAVLLLVTGLISLAISVHITLLENVRNLLTHFMLQQSHLLPINPGTILGLLLVAFGTYVAYKGVGQLTRQCYRLKIGGHAVSIDKNVVREHLERYLQKLFPDGNTKCDVLIVNNRFKISIELPPMGKIEQEAMIQKFKEELRELLATSFSYHDQFSLFVAFLTA